MFDVDLFFDFSVEDKFNDKMCNGTLVFDSLKDYVIDLLMCPTSTIIQHICAHKISRDLPKAIFTPFSNIDSATRKTPLVLKTRDKGVDYVSLGRLLQDDGVARNVGTDRKYGEQQGKLAVELGLARRVDKMFFPSALGSFSTEMKDEEFNRLLERLVLRSTLIRLVIQECDSQEIVHLKELCGLSESMYSKVRAKFKNLRKILMMSIETNYEWFDQKVDC